MNFSRRFYKIGMIGTIGGLLLYNSPVSAHIEKGPMPDAVAEMEYRILLEFKPEDTSARNMLAMVLYRLDKLTEAEAELSTVLKYDPQNFDALDSLGLVKTKQKRFSEAEQIFQQAIKIRPEDPLVYYNLAQLYLQTENPTGAESALKSGLTKVTSPQSKEGRSLVEKFEAALQEMQIKTK